jgi:hypothetical protein
MATAMHGTTDSKNQTKRPNTALPVAAPLPLGGQLS